MRRAFLALCVCVGLYQAYNFVVARKASQAAQRFLALHPLDAKRPPSPAGFVSVLMPDGVNPDVMTVFTPAFCPMAAGVRGRALVAKMKAANIPVVESSKASIEVHAKDQAEADIKRELLVRLNTIMTGETPIVFYQGRAKNNPSIADVQMEFAAGK